MINNKLSPGLNGMKIKLAINAGIGVIMHVLFPAAFIV